MSLFARIPHSYIFPGLRQLHRKSDGVRGLFTTRRVPCGSLLVSLPISYCYFCERPSSPHYKYLLQANRTSHLFPEMNLWLRQYTTTGADVSPCLRASCSCEEDPKGVVTFDLTPTEAALVSCIALRFFFRAATGGRPYGWDWLSDVSLRSSVAEVYVRSLPISLLLQQGVESFAAGCSALHDALHVCLEQVALNLRDEMLSHVNNRAYALLDKHMELFNDIVLTSLYVIRSRVLPILLLAPQKNIPDTVLKILAPGIDAMNHSILSNSSVAISPKRKCAVVRAVTDIKAGEEITINYKIPGSIVSGDSFQLWESQYLIRDVT